MILQGSCEIIWFVFVCFSLTSTISTSTFSYQVIYLLISCRNIYLSIPSVSHLRRAEELDPKKVLKMECGSLEIPNHGCGKKIGTKNTKTASNFAAGWWFFWIEDGISVNFLLVTFWKGSKKLHASKFLWYDWYGHFLPPYLSKDNHAMLTGARELPIRPISLSIHMFCAYRYAHTERRIRKYIYIYIYTTF